MSASKGKSCRRRSPPGWIGVLVPAAKESGCGHANHAIRERVGSSAPFPHPTWHHPPRDDVRQGVGGNSGRPGKLKGPGRFGTVGTTGESCGPLAPLTRRGTPRGEVEFTPDRRFPGPRRVGSPFHCTVSARRLAKEKREILGKSGDERTQREASPPEEGVPVDMGGGGGVWLARVGGKLAKLPPAQPQTVAPRGLAAAALLCQLFGKVGPQPQPLPVPSSRAAPAGANCSGTAGAAPL